MIFALSLTLSIVSTVILYVVDDVVKGLGDA